MLTVDGGDGRPRYRWLESLADATIDYSEAYVAAYEGAVTGDNTTLFYYGEANAKHHDPLTPEIISKYSLDLNALRLYRTTVILTGQSYSDFISATFDPDLDRFAATQTTSVDVQ